MSSEEIFTKHLATPGGVHDLSAISDELPKEPATLRGLAARCRVAEREAAGAGEQFEAKRLRALAMQLDELAGKG